MLKKLLPSPLRATLNILLALGIGQAALADDIKIPTDTCFDDFKAVLAAAPTVGTYPDAVLDHLHDEFYRFNKIQTADVKMVFCRLTTVLGMSSTLTSLPQTLTKTDPIGGKTVLTVSAPTESFATSLGYTAKGVLANSDTTFLTIWWGGDKAETSKGYLIQGNNPMANDGNTRLRYLQWDLTSTTQVVKVLATQFATSYLGSATASATSKSGSDQAIYARVSYDTATKAITAQDLEVRPDKNSTDPFSCIRTYFTGTLGGTMAGYRPAKGTPESVAETSTGGTSSIGGLGMDGESGLTDSTDTADKSGTQAAGSDIASGTFDHSCKDLNSAATADSTFSPFAGGKVSYTAVPTSIFP